MREEIKIESEESTLVPRTLFKPVSWLGKIDFINHLILFNNVLITILAEKKGGKSSFCTVLQNNLDKQIKSVFIKIAAPCDTEIILHYVANELHLNKDSNTTIGTLAAQINERKAHVLILIDNAQNLPELFIKESMIATKKQGASGFFHLCLVSDYSLVATINTLSTDSFNNLVHTIDLGALTENETRTYVLQRAMTANIITTPLSDVHFKQFFQLTKGSVAKINSSMESFILDCKPITKVKKKEILIKKGALLLSVLGVFSLFSLYCVQFYKSRWAENNILEQNAASRASSSTTDSALASLTNPADFASQIPYWLDGSQHQLMEVALPKQQILDGEETENINTVALVDKVIVIPKIKPGVDLSRAQALIVKGASTSASKVSKYRQTVAKNSSKLYTIQLVSSHEIEDVTRFRENNPLLVDAKIRYFNNSKGEWYILTLGEYADKNQAQQQANQLPSAFSQLEPWVRSVSGLADIG